MKTRSTIFFAFAAILCFVALSETDPTLGNPATAAPVASSALARGDEAFDKKDYVEAMKWYLKAASQGDVKAENSIGFMYDNGIGVRQDYVAAMRWYRRAADHRYAVAQYNVGLHYDSGLGVPRNLCDAQLWMRRAAAAGNKDAKTWLGSHTRNRQSDRPIEWSNIKNYWIPGGDPGFPNFAKDPSMTLQNAKLARWANRYPNFNRAQTGQIVYWQGSIDQSSEQDGCRLIVNLAAQEGADEIQYIARLKMAYPLTKILGGRYNLLFRGTIDRIVAETWWMQPNGLPGRLIKEEKTGALPIPINGHEGKTHRAVSIYIDDVYVISMSPNIQYIPCEKVGICQAITAALASVEDNQITLVNKGNYPTKFSINFNTDICIAGVQKSPSILKSFIGKELTVYASANTKSSEPISALGVSDQGPQIVFMNIRDMEKDHSDLPLRPDFPDMDYLHLCGIYAP